MDKILQTYDATLLKFDSKERQKYFQLYSKIIIENIKKFPKANIALATCVNNYYTKNQPKINYLNGPRGVTYHISKEYNMEIYIFYEIHNMEGPCEDGALNLVEYFKKLIATSPRFLDIFLETTPIKIDNSKNTSVLGQLYNNFRHCFIEHDYENCPRNARIHYIDIRDKMFDHDLNTIKKIFL